MIALLLAGCASEPWALRRLAGAWTGTVRLESGDRPVVATFLATDHLEGDVAVEDPDAVRRYEVLAADEVPPLGFSLHLLEVTGVRELTISVVEDLPPLDGWWETRTFCYGSPDGWCREGGALHLERVDPGRGGDRGAPRGPR